MSDLPEEIRKRGSMVLTWYRAKTTEPLNYPTTEEDHWLPAGATGWALRNRGSWVLLPEESAEWWGVRVPEHAIDVSDEFVQATYDLRSDDE